ncbi:camphor resistance protein CrcB [Roseovarius sp. HI0049]|nr:camphor resistance protein CrcB [Roseovarius sp. HI0049]
MLQALVLGGSVWAAPVLADEDDIVRVKAAGDVGAVMAALEQAVEGAGATVFAKVDHGAGAEGAGLELGASQLLIFGNPQLGTPAMQANPLAGLYLPLKVLVYEDAGGQVWLAYEEPEETLDDLDGVDDDDDYIAKMTGALKKLTTAAAGG